MTKMKRFFMVSALALLPALLLGQGTGPTVYTPRLTVSPGPLTVTTDDTTVQDLIILGTCTGCVGTANFANPTGTIGLTAVNGVATTGIRSDGAPALSQAIAPSWSALHSFTLSRTNAVPSVLINSTVPGLRWDETDAAADNRLWEITASAEAFRIGSILNDAGTLQATAMQVDRTAGTIDSIQLSGTSISALGIFFTNGSRLELENTAPITQGDETDAPANERSYLVRQQAGDWFLSTATDAAPQAAVNNALTVSRTGTTVDSVAIAATTATVNGQNICRADGTGCPSGFSGLANPTGTIGLSAVNGSATTALRSDGAPALSQAIAPTWTATHSFTNDGAQASFVGNNPRYLISESDAAVDSKNWLNRSVGGTYAISMANDAAPFSVVADAVTITRTGTTANIFRINTTSVQQNGDIIPNVTSAPTWTGAHLFTSSGAASGTAPIFLQANAPFMRVQETDAAANSQVWYHGPTSASWRIGVGSDASTTPATNAITIARTNNTIDAITLDATSVTVNSSEVCRANGTGCNTTGAANPTGTIGLAAVNGSATTYLRSDGAPALSQSIAPTWTGVHIFTAARTEVESATPIVQVDETDAASNERNWLLRSNAGALTVSTATDAAPTTAVANPVVIDRTGTTVDSVTLTATTVAVTGAATVSGSATVSGNIAVNGGITKAACSATVADGTVNNYDIFAACGSTEAIVRLNSAAGTTLTGMVLPSNQYVTIINVGTTNIVFNDEDGGSSGTNQFVNIGSLATCTAGTSDMLVVWKDPTTDKVRVFPYVGIVCGA